MTLLAPPRATGNTLDEAGQPGAAAPDRQQQRFTRSGLHLHARPLHQRPIRLLNAGWLCVIAAAVLSVIGVLAIGTTEPQLGLKHLAHLCIGVMGAAVVAVPHYRVLERLSYPLMIVVLGLLVFVLIPAVPEFIVKPRNDARRWINLYVMDFQPSELAKIAYVLLLACYLKYRRNYRTLRGLLLPLVLTFIPMGLILVEPDLGTAMLLLPTLFAMLIAAGAKIRHLVLVALVGMALAPAMYPMLRPHQKNRIRAMIAQVSGDERYERDIGFQAAKAIMLAGAGGGSGVGTEHAADLVQFNALPEEHNDMIFAVISCRWGFVGAIAVWAAYLLLAAGALIVAAQTRDALGRLVPVGLVAVLMSQMIINTGMTIGLLPITGMTLPFVSYGGSSLLSSWLMIGLIVGVALRRPRFMERQSFQFESEAS